MHDLVRNWNNKCDAKPIKNEFYNEELNPCFDCEHDWTDSYEEDKSMCRNYCPKQN